MISIRICKSILTFFVFIPTLFFAQITAKVIGIKDGDTVLVLEKNNIQKMIKNYYKYYYERKEV